MEQLMVGDKRIYKLQVDELRKELEDRSLSTKGGRQRLLLRLAQHMINSQWMMRSLNQREKNVDVGIQTDQLPQLLSALPGQQLQGLYEFVVQDLYVAKAEDDVEEEEMQEEEENLEAQLENDAGTSAKKRKQGLVKWYCRWIKSNLQQDVKGRLYVAGLRQFLHRSMEEANISQQNEWLSVTKLLNSMWGIKGSYTCGSHDKVARKAGITLSRKGLENFKRLTGLAVKDIIPYNAGSKPADEGTFEIISSPPSHRRTISVSVSSSSPSKKTNG